ncbi:MAG: alkaline phosphatase PhoX [Bacteroidota bacterium]
MHASRRTFLRQSLAISAGFMGLSSYLTHARALASPTWSPIKQWLELPEGFTIKIISRWGDKMSDGFFVPNRHDGMAAFDINGKVVLIRNHENSPTPTEFGPFNQDEALFRKLAKADFFDYGSGEKPGLGGTTTIVYDEASQTVQEQYLSLIGTNRNCAGGPTPWNTWISCEEDVTPAGNSHETAHGYNFEIPAVGKGLIEPVPLRAMGRFNHEAVCVDPTTSIVYQTEDSSDSLIYRYLPKTPGKLHQGGVLQALVVQDQPGLDTRNWETQTVAVNQPLTVRWLTLEDVEPTEDDLRLRGHAAGAALFARGEGMWFGSNEVYFACTNGGRELAGQVFKYVPSPYEGTPREKEAPGTLTLFAEPNDTDLLKSCDNLTVAPWGDVVLVEDKANSHIRGITPQGEIYTIGRNIGSDSELAGACFSPSGQTFFVNVQNEGLTLAVTGPWGKLRKG